MGGYGALIRHLIGARASVEAREDGRTALMRAAELGGELAAGILIEVRADVDAVSSAGETPLMRASRNAQDVCASLP